MPLCFLDLMTVMHQNGIRKIHLIQNPAAWLLKGTTRIEHIAVLAVLNWLPLSFRKFKILLLVFKAMIGQVPAYICDKMIPYDLTSFSQIQASHLALECPAWVSQASNSVSSFQSLSQTLFYLIAST